MKRNEFSDFVKSNLTNFKNEFKVTKDKRELKKAVYDNPKLNERQKDTFWLMVTNNSEEKTE